MGDSLLDHDHDENINMDLKPAAVDHSGDPFHKSNFEELGHHHAHDHSLGSIPSVHSKGRAAVHFKDDTSEMLSLLEGSTVIPLPHSHGSQRLRDSSINSYTPIALDHSQASTSSRMSQFQRKGAPSSSQPSGAHQAQSTPLRRHNQDGQDSSLLSQVANHILGTFGTSWAESDSITPGREGRRNNHHHRQPRPTPHHDNIPAQHNHSNEMETELGQEVVMDVRDEGSMPPPEPRENELHIDWPSRAGCHSWIPETIGANASAFFGQNYENENRLADVQDHSLMRQNSYSRADISPVNSLDMEMSQSSLGGRQRNRGTVLVNVFDSKHDDPAEEDYHPHMHHHNHGALHQVPSWEKSFRSNLSLGDLGDEEDDSLIQVNSYDVKQDLQHQNSHSSGQMMPPPAPVNHHPPASDQAHRNQHLDESDDMDMGMDWEGHHPGE
jgi:hypothetical protein